MADFNQASATVSAVQGLSDVATGITQAQASKAQANFAASQYDFNARFAELQAQDAVKRGERRASKIREYGKQVSASQRAGYAAGGIDVSFGTPAAVIEETEVMAGEDAEAEIRNAWREKWGFSAQASNYRQAADLTRVAGKREAGASIATGLTRGLTSGIAAGYYGNEALRDAKAKGKSSSTAPVKKYTTWGGEFT